MNVSRHRLTRLLAAWNLLAAAAAATAASWPVPTSHEVLHSYGTPIRAGARLLHTGIDILGAGHEVLAVRSGTVHLPLGSSACPQVWIRTTAGGASQTDKYLHVAPAVMNGVHVAAGARLGTISWNCPGHQLFQHLHWEVSPSTSTSALLVNPLSVLPPAQRDPNGSPAEVRDVDGASGSLRVVARDPSSGHVTSPSGVVVWGSVDLIVDASDDMSPGRDMDVAPYALAYWIESHSGGSDVASADAPYQVFCFGQQTLDDDALGVVCHDSICPELEEPTDTPWPRFLSWAVTKASRRRPPGGPCEAWLPPTLPSGFWKTTAKAGGSCEPNGSNCPAAASSNGSARFPDGLHRLHVETTDLASAASSWQIDLLVDNWSPHVSRVVAGPEGAEQDLYEVVWAPERSMLVARRAEQASRSALLRPGQARLRLSVTFSEPVASAALAIGDTSRPLPGTSVAAGLRAWEWDLDVSRLGGTGEVEISIWAMDLAGNPLLPISRSRRAAPSSHPHPRQPRPQRIVF
jgi:hypothetical protein